MSCFEWKYNVQLSGLSVTANITYEEPNEDPSLPPVNVLISGSQLYDNVGPPYDRRQMRCGIQFKTFYAYRAGFTGYRKFWIDGDIAPSTYEGYYPLDVTFDGEGDIKAGIFSAYFDLYPTFPTGLFKPWKETDPAFPCAQGVWSKSKNITKGQVKILTNEGVAMAFGFYDRIESGAEITYFKPDDLENSIGTGNIFYTIT